MHINKTNYISQLFKGILLKPPITINELSSFKPIAEKVQRDSFIGFTAIHLSLISSYLEENVYNRNTVSINFCFLMF